MFWLPSTDGSTAVVWIDSGGWGWCGWWVGWKGRGGSPAGRDIITNQLRSCSRTRLDIVGKTAKVVVFLLQTWNIRRTVTSGYGDLGSGLNIISFFLLFIEIHCFVLNIQLGLLLKFQKHVGILFKALLKTN